MNLRNVASRDRVRALERIVVTGAASGIGRAVALQLAGDGAELALLDRDAERLVAVGEEAERAGSATAAAIPVDVADGEAVLLGAGPETRLRSPRRAQATPRCRAPPLRSIPRPTPR